MIKIIKKQALYTQSLSICFGGMNNIQRVLVVLDITATRDDLQVINSIVDDINKVYIHAHSLDKIQLRVLNQRIHDLTQYSAIQFQHRIRLKIGMTQFFQNEINAMPRHKTEPGHLGYDAYQQELHAIHGVMVIFNKTLNLVALPELSVPMPLVIHDYFPVPYDDHNISQSVPALPLSLDAFEQSIALTRECKMNWETCLSQYAIPYLEGYFQSIASLIQHLNVTSPLRAQAMVLKINHFTAILDPSLFGVKMMQDAARISCSPITRVRRRISTETNINVNKQGLGEGEIKESCDHIRHPPSLYEEKFKNLIRLLKGTLAINDKSNEFKEAFISFQNELLMMMNEFPLKKYDLLKLLRKDLGHYVHTDVNRCLVGYYLQRLEQRVKNPIPEQALKELTALRKEYGAEGCTPRQQLKLQFFSAVEQDIREHPEKTYSECISMVKGTPQQLYQTLFRSRSLLSGYSFFNHRFEAWIDGLERLDPKQPFL